MKTALRGGETPCRAVSGPAEACVKTRLAVERVLRSSILSMVTRDPLRFKSLPHRRLDNGLSPMIIR